MMTLFTHRRTRRFWVVSARETELAGMDNVGSAGRIGCALPSLSTNEVVLVIVFVVVRQRRHLRLLRQLFPLLQWTKPRVIPADTLPDACVVLPDNVDVDGGSVWKLKNSAFANATPPPG
jgi:hypothetical protein